MLWLLSVVHAVSSDVLNDKFHTTVDKLTRFCLCCCFTRGHSCLIPTQGDSELPALVSYCMFHVLSGRCDTVLSQNLSFECKHISPVGLKSGELYRFVLNRDQRLCSAQIHVDNLSLKGVGVPKNPKKLVKTRSTIEVHSCSALFTILRKCVLVFPQPSMGNSQS